jgi:hypothetical protein
LLQRPRKHASAINEGLAAPSIADLKAKLAGRVVSEAFGQLQEQVRLSKLQLLGPDGAIDLKFEHARPNSERATMRRDLWTDDLRPLRPNAVRERDAVQAEITEHLTDELADRLEASLATRSAAARSKTHAASLSFPAR